MGRLCVTRRTDDKLFIGDDVVIEFVRVNNGNARVRIIAPDYMSIVRGELLSELPPEQPKSIGE